MLGFKLPGLTINTISPVNYPTTLKTSEVNALKKRLETFDFGMSTNDQYMEVESIMNKLNGTLGQPADQMDLASLFVVLDEIKRSKTYNKPADNFVNVLLKIAERIKGQTGGMIRTLRFSSVSNKGKKGGTRTSPLPKSNTRKFRKNVLNAISARTNITNMNKRQLIERYEEAVKAGLATSNEISALVGLTQLRLPGKLKRTFRRQY